MGDITGPVRSLGPRLERLAEQAPLDVVVPFLGSATAELESIGRLRVMPTRAERIPSTRATPGYLLSAVRDFLTFYRYFRRSRPSTVIVVTSHQPAVLLAAKFARSRTIVYVGEILWTDRDSASRKVKGRLLASFTEHLADGLVCCSRLVADQFNRSRSIVRVVHPGIESLAPYRARSTVRSLLGLPDSAFVVCTAGIITRGRGHDIVLRAVQEARRTRGQICCLVLGSPGRDRNNHAYLRELERLAETPGLANAVYFAGTVPNAQEIFSAVDLVINASRVPEPFGRVLPEALAAGTPVAGADVGAIGDVLDRGRLGRLFSPDNVTETAAAILASFDSPPNGGLRASAAAETEERFGVEEGTHAFLEIVGRVERLAE